MLKTDFFQLLLPTDAQKEHWVSRRTGEVRIGEMVSFRNESSEWKQQKYHVLGIKESIGPQVNKGFSGAENGFEAFVVRFLGLQSNEFLSGDAICMHGSIVPTSDERPSSMLVADLDVLVTNWAREVKSSGGIPIVIGGGHNNAYGLIKGAAQALEHGIAVVNLDPHADMRDLEGRHSGNPFSYAMEGKCLKSYAVIGLHESYNNAEIFRRLQDSNSYYSFFENWLDDPNRFQHDLKVIHQQFDSKQTGIELDMDSIAWMPSSAFTPSGISLEQARMYVRSMARLHHVVYLHLPEAAPQTTQDEKVVGKALTYLVSDFIKVHSNFHKT